MQPISFIGLGNMGSNMARNLLRGSAPLFVYNRSKEKANELIKEGAKLLDSPADSFKKANVVLSMLANDKAVEEVNFGPNGLLESIQPGSIHVSMSTISPEISNKLDKIYQEKGAHYLAAPVFGRPDVASAAQLWICIAGNSEAKKRVEPILKLLGQRIDDFGERPENANIVKISGNFMMVSAMEAMGEVFRLAKENGVDPQLLAKFFGETIFSSIIYQTYGKIISTAAFEPAGLKMVLGLKDIDLFRKAAENSRLTMPLADLLSKLFNEGISKGRGEMDWSAITLSAINLGK